MSTISKTLLHYLSITYKFVFIFFRHSGKRLLDAVFNGIKAFKSNFEDFGIITTPMLHFFVRCYNTNGLYGQPNEHSYYSKLTNSFKTMRKMASTFLCLLNQYNYCRQYYQYNTLVFRVQKL